MLQIDRDVPLWRPVKFGPTVLRQDTEGALAALQGLHTVCYFERTSELMASLSPDKNTTCPYEVSWLMSDDPTLGWLEGTAWCGMEQSRMEMNVGVEKDQLHTSLHTPQSPLCETKSSVCA